MKQNPKFLFDQWIQKHADVYPQINAALYGANPTQQVVDHILYAAKSVSGVSTFDDLVKTDDSLAVGLTNIAQAQLPANQFFMLTGISIQYAVAAGTTADNVKAADYKNILPAAIRNGETSIAVNKKPILDKILSEVFATAGEWKSTGDTNAAAGTAVTYTMGAGGVVGYYELDNPKMIEPQQLIEIKMKFAAAAASNAALRIQFHGATNVTA